MHSSGGEEQSQAGVGEETGDVSPATTTSQTRPRFARLERRVAVDGRGVVKADATALLHETMPAVATESSSRLRGATREFTGGARLTWYKGQHAQASHRTASSSAAMSCSTYPSVCPMTWTR